MGITVDDVYALIDDASLPREGSDISWAVDDANALVFSLLTPKGVDQVRKDMVAKYLAAHMVILNVERGGLIQDRMGDASQVYMDRGYVTGLRSTRYGEMAIVLDPTGSIANMDANKVGTASFRVV